MFLSSFQFIGLLVLTVFCVSTYSQQLSAVEVAKIPHLFYRSTVFYDGDEWIYTFHIPNDDVYHPQLWRLSVSNFTLEKVAEHADHFHFYGYGATVNKTAYFFGDTFRENYVLQFTVGESSDLTVVPGIGVSNSFYSTAVTYKNEVIIICSYYCSNIYKFSPEKMEVSLLGEIPDEHLKMYVGSVVVKNKVYIFGTPYSKELETNQTHSVLNLDTLEYEYGQGDLDYLEYSQVPAATTDGELIYLIPSHSQYIIKNRVQDPTTSRQDGIYQINPETNTHQFLPVENFPVNDKKSFLDAPASIYVEKVNGIFMIGGRRREVGTISPTEYLNQIYFIDLSPLNSQPTTLSQDRFPCGEHTDGFYPNPLDSAKFIECHDGIPKYYECPSSLLFDPIIGTCNTPQKE